MRLADRWTAAAATGMAALVLVAGCGVQLQSAAEPLPPNVLPAPLVVPSESAAPSPKPTPSPSPQATTSLLRLWFVQDDGLAAAESDLPTGSDPDLVLQALAIGPDASQSAEGLRTVARDPLTGAPLVSVAPAVGPSALPTVSPSPTSAVPTFGPPTMAPASVTVMLSAAFAALPPAEQVLLLGQVVLSLTGAGEESVAFTDEAGTPVAVPLPDGRLLAEPATARDYNELIVRP